MVNPMYMRISLFCLTISWFVFLLISFINVCTLELHTLLYITIIILHIIIIIILALFNALYCLNVFPLVRYLYFIITFHKLLMDMNFLVLFCIVHFTLSKKNLSLTLLNIEHECYYFSLVISTYTNFKVMLNMASFSQLYFGIVAMLLCIIVMVTSMILIHCVIAIMSNIVTDMFEHRARIQRMYRL